MCVYAWESKTTVVLISCHLMLLFSINLSKRLKNKYPSKVLKESYEFKKKTFPFTSLLPSPFISVFLFKVIKSWLWLWGSMWHSYWLTCLITLTPGPQKTISARWSTYSFYPLAKSPPPPSPLRLPAMPLVLPFTWIKKGCFVFRALASAPGSTQKVSLWA